MLGQPDIQKRCKLQVADISLRRIARKAHVVPREGLKIAAGTEFWQSVAESHDGHDLPFSAAESIAAGGGDHASTEAGRPTRVEVINKDGLSVGIAYAVKIVPVGITGRDGVLGKKR